MQSAVEKLKRSNKADLQAIARNLERNSGMSNLGAIGPDIFFWAPDYELADKLFDFYAKYENVVEAYHRITAPIRDVKNAVGDATEAVVETLAPDTLKLIKLSMERVKETAGYLKNAISTELLSGLLGVGDLFNEMGMVPGLTNTLFTKFAPTLQSQLAAGVPHDVSTWYWFDLLHYRRTGLFARNLVSLAAGNNVQQAYAYGYLSHIATDTVGHAFVNQVVGGPYRVNVQRHALVENYMDTWAFNQYFDADISDTLLSKLNLPAPDNLPEDVVSLLRNALRQTYNDLHPTRLGNEGFLTAGDIRTTYERFYKMLGVTAKMCVKRPDEPFDNVADILAEALDDLLEAPPSPPSLPDDLETCSWQDILSAGLSENSRDCYETFFKEAKKYFEYLGELLAWTFETLMDLVDLVIASLLALPVTVLLALLYGIQLLAYQMYNAAKAAIADAGLTYPSADMLNTSVGLAATSTFFNCSPPFKYPKFRQDSFSHLVCPLSAIENPATAPDFNLASRDIRPDTFMDTLAFNEASLRKYAQSASPEKTRNYYNAGIRIGNAADFASWMIGVASRPSSPDRTILETDWNLDSDRGYCYKNWDGTGDYSNPLEPKINAERYL